MLCTVSHVWGYVYHAFPFYASHLDPRRCGGVAEEVALRHWGRCIMPPENFISPPENFILPPENFISPPENFIMSPENFITSPGNHTLSRGVLHGTCPRICPPVGR